LERALPIGFEFAGRAAWLDNRYKLLLLSREYREGNAGYVQDDFGEVNAPGTGARALARSIKGLLQGNYRLFDLVADPEETNDIARLHPAVVWRMAVELQEWRDSVKRSANGADYTN
jgi:ribosomal protein S6